MSCLSWKCQYDQGNIQPQILLKARKIWRSQKWRELVKNWRY